MRLFSVILAVAALAVAGTAMAADVPSTTLGQMGIRGMQTVSDAEGMAIRGKGFTQVNLSNAGDFYITLAQQINFAQVTQATLPHLQGTAAGSVASWQENRFDGQGQSVYLAGGLVGSFQQNNSILDQQNVVSRLGNIGQLNEIAAVGGPGYVPNVDTGPTIDIQQTNSLQTAAPGNLQTTPGVLQRNLVDVSISINQQAVAVQFNSIVAGYGRLGATQQNFLIVP